MAALQVMHHYAYLVMATELEKAIRENSGRRTCFLTRSLKKTVNQLHSFQEISKTLFAIQKLNPYAPRARQAYARRALEMVNMNQKSISKIVEAMKALEQLAGEKM
jgi:hypothetical protein